MKAIIVGAGRGIRLMPETEGIPKCMMDGVGGQCVLEKNIGGKKDEIGLFVLRARHCS